MLNSKTPLLACVLAALLGVGATLGLQNDESVRKLSAVKLPNVPAQTLTAEVVEYPPGGKSSVHHHAGSVFAYILTGRIRSQNSGPEPTRNYKAGETFFEPPKGSFGQRGCERPRTRKLVGNFHGRRRSNP